MKVEIEKHDRTDKSFGLTAGEWFAKVDYDDVNHSYVDAMTEYLKVLIEENFVEWQFNTFLKEKLYTEWINDAELREEYETIEEYLKTRGL